MSTQTSLVGLAFFLGVCFLGAAVGTAVGGPAIAAWLTTLQTPGWMPPNWVFPLAWTPLYILMAVAAWLVWKQHGFAGARGALGLFVLQLMLNFAWTPLFFGLQRPDLGLYDIVALWFAIAVTIVAFWPKSKMASALLLPYLAWVTFAAVLNYTIWQMNA